MGKITCFHGTTADNLKNIRKEGLKRHGPKLWCVSENAIYFWSVDHVNTYNGEEESENPWGARSRAIESAQLALIKSKDCRIVLVECELGEDEIEEDTSCENMGGAICIYRDIKPEEIKSIEISNDLSLLRGYFATFALNRSLSNIELTAFEEKIAKVFSSSDLYLDELEDFIQLKKVRC